MGTASSRLRGVTTVLTVALLIGGCNARSPLPDEGVSIAPSPAPAPLPVALYALSLNPPGLFGTAPSSGTVILTRQASEGGVTVTLSSGDPSIVTVPSSVMVPEGTDRATFPIATRTVTDDRQVPIDATTAGTLATSPLSVWAVLPTFFTFLSDPGEPVGRSGFGRYTTATATISGGGSDARVTIRVIAASSDIWDLQFDAPRNGRLQVGPYENAVRSGTQDATHPGLSVSGRGTGCGAISGRFVIRELGFTPGPSGPTVTQFDATYEQHCNAGVPALRGEVRFTTGAR